MPSTPWPSVAFFAQATSGSCRAGRRVRHRKYVDPLRRQRLDAIEQCLIAPGAEDFCCAHRQRQRRGIEPELAADAVDQQRLAGADADLLHRRIGGAEIAEPRGGFEAHIVGQLDQRGRRRGDELRQPAVRIGAHDLLRAAEIALQRPARTIVGLAAPAHPARAARAARIDIDALARPHCHTCSPTLATTPAGSRPKIAGSGGIILLSGVSVPK